MACDSNNFQHIKKILRISVDNLVLQVRLKFRVDRVKTFWVLLLTELKDADLTKARLRGGGLP